MLGLKTSLVKRLSVLIVVVAVTVGQAAEIVTFEFSALAGNEATAGSNAQDANLNAATISRGAGLTASANGGRFNATAWALSSIANAVSGNNYMEFTITPKPGYQFNVSSIYVQWQRSATGNTKISLRSSVDSYSTDLDSVKDVVDNTSTQPFTWNFTQTNRSAAVTYRLYSYAEATGGSGGPGDGTGNDIIVNGTVSASGGAPGSAIVITNGGATVAVNSYELKGTNDSIVGTMIFSNTTTGVQYTQAAPGTPFGWSQTFSSLASGANSIVVTGTNMANTRATATTTITYNPPAPPAASNIVAVTAPSSAQETVVGMPVSIVTESWSNHTAQIGYGPTSNGSGWLWFTVSASAGGLGYTATASFTMPIGTNYIGARWINGGITNYGWSSAGQINATTLATPLYISVTNTPSMLLTTPWDFSNGNLSGLTCGAGMSTNLGLLATSYATGFEDAAKAAYAAGDVVLSNSTWNMDNAVIGNLANDKKIDAWSCRGRHPFTNSMVDAKAGGVGAVSLKYARYGTDAGVVAVVEYSVDGGEWTQAGASFDSTSVDTLADWSATLNVSGNVKLRILSTSGTAGSRMNIDNIVLTGSGGGSYSGVLAVNGFSHGTSADVASNVTFTMNTTGYQSLGFYCTVRRDATGPRTLDLDFYNGASWSEAAATYELNNAGVWYTVGRSFEVAGAANTAFRLVGYGATGSQLELQDPVVTAPLPEPMLLGVASLALLTLLRVKR